MYNTENNYNDKMLFLRYDKGNLRHQMMTDFYTQQTVEEVKYNVEKLINNIKIKLKEVNKFER